MSDPPSSPRGLKGELVAASRAVEVLKAEKSSLEQKCQKLMAVITKERGDLKLVLAKAKESMEKTAAEKEAALKKHAEEEKLHIALQCEHRNCPSEIARLKAQIDMLETCQTKNSAKDENASAGLADAENQLAELARQLQMWRNEANEANDRAAELQAALDRALADNANQSSDWDAEQLQAQQKQRFRECGLRLLNMQLKFKSRDFYQLKLSWCLWAQRKAVSPAPPVVFVPSPPTSPRSRSSTGGGFPGHTWNEVPSPQSDPQGIGIMSAMISEVRPTSPGRPRSVSAARRQRTAFPNGEDEL